ncbi:hypothetical protein RF679_17705 [Undibacterium cyanobacteriorum]|uniref:Uncharacterized protein n=1 Tax=Undibacterium cyanobacteriorum TaxID=3073561 RepID=A0ABY9RHY7_9BURK|nr:hypothetical protein [Undibacterium sp. 20NA77.5]WMW80458.1 hypothetical protein RF679_17705 [Undibacterium sp. 20NA77.5]
MEKILDAFYDKTDKGREEIASRAYHLSSKLRPLLVMIDGKHSGEELIRRLATIGLNATHLEELLSAGFIERITQDAAITPQGAGTKQVAPVASDIVSKIDQSNHPVIESSNNTVNVVTLTTIRQFFTDSIKANLGLRGFTLQLKVERADSIDDFKQLGEDFIETLHNSKGQQFARTIEARMLALFSQIKT